MKYIYLGLISCFMHQLVMAQQLPLLSEYSHSAFLLNPAMTGWENNTAIQLSYRHQWTGMGIKHSPITAYLNGQHYSSKYNTGVALNIMHDQTGPTSFTGIQANYAYHIKLRGEKEKRDRRNRLAIGMSLSALQYRLDGSQLQYLDADDPLIIQEREQRILPEMGAGILYYNDIYYVGISAPQLLSLNVKFDDDNALSNMRRVAHFYFNAGAKVELRTKGDKQYTEAQHQLFPSIWFKYVPNTPMNFQLALRYLWKKQFGLGMAYSTDGSMLTEVSVVLKRRFRIAYGFSMPMGGWTRYLGTNHELMLSYVFGSQGKGWNYYKLQPQILKKF